MIFHQHQWIAPNQTTNHSPMSFFQLGFTTCWPQRPQGPGLFCQAHCLQRNVGNMIRKWGEPTYFLVFFLMGYRSRLKNHEQFVTNQQAPSRNHSEGERFNKIMHHQTCIQHTYIDKIRGCCKRNMWKLAWVPRMHPETGLTQQLLELKFCHVRALNSYFL